MALDEPALGDITGVGGALQCGQVLLVGSGSEVVHHTKRQMIKLISQNSNANLKDRDPKSIGQPTKSQTKEAIERQTLKGL